MKCTEKILKMTKGVVMEYFPSEQMVVCDGEIYNVTEDGKVLDCTCSTCGKSYGRHYLDPARVRFMESFVGV